MSCHLPSSVCIVVSLADANFIASNVKAFGTAFSVIKYTYSSARFHLQHFSTDVLTRRQMDCLFLAYKRSSFQTAKVVVPNVQFSMVVIFYTILWLTVCDQL